MIEASMGEGETEAAVNLAEAAAARL